MLTLALTLVAVASGGVGVAAAVGVSRGQALGARALLAAGGAAVLTGALAAVALVARAGGFPLFAVAHLAYLGLTLTVPLLAVGLAALAGPIGHRTAARPVWALLVVALLPAPVGVYATHVEPRRLRVDHHVVALDPERAGDDEVRIAVLADLQTNHVGDHERRAVTEVLAAEPDVILLPGDLFQGSDDELDGEVEAMRELLGRLDAPHGVYFVRGDVDGGGHADRVLAGTGIETLDDEVAEIEVGDRTLRIGGTRLAYASAAADEVRAASGAPRSTGPSRSSSVIAPTPSPACPPGPGSTSPWPATSTVARSSSPSSARS